MVSRIALTVLASLAPSATCSGGFMQANPAVNAAQVRKELQGVLDEVLGQGHGMSAQNLQEITGALKPLFVSLPKNSVGHISAPVMRYVVQRYFSQQHGWIVKGFEPHAKTANISGPDVDILKSNLPDYVRTALEQRFSHQGFGLDDTAVMVAAVERLTYDEVVRGVERAFRLNELPLTSELTTDGIMDILTSYFITEMNEGSDDIKQHQNAKKNIYKWYPHWSTTILFIMDLQLDHIYGQRHHQNPFFTKPFYFEDATQIAQQISKHFALWSNHECHLMKEVLMERDPYQTGRVKLNEFYGNILEDGGDWQFRESKDYLESLGALDESSHLVGPQVIIPNYISGMSNCITSTPYYSICCMNECDHVYKHLEAAIPASHATPDQIIEAVEGISRSQVGITSKSMSSFVREKLDVMTSLHKGEIPLHGRLMAQWLHYVFPHDCPYPHMDGVNPITPDTLMKQNTVQVLAQDVDIKEFLEAESSRRLHAQSPESGNNMWTLQEHVLEHSTPIDIAESRFRHCLRLCTYLGMLGGFAALMVQKLLPSVKGHGKQQKLWQHYDV